MNLKSIRKRAASLLMCGAMTTGMLTGLTGCGNDDDDVITLTVFSQLANYSGEQMGWFAQVMLEKFNVKLNIIPDQNGTLQTRMESGDLGDIVVWGSNGTSYQNAIDAGLLLDWNEDDLLSDYGEYIEENMADELANNASYSGGTTYGIGHGVGGSDSSALQEFFYTWDVRWDLYKELGYPSVSSYDDLVELFKDMKEICPTDDNGNETYAVSLWPDWDGSMVMYVKSTATAFYGYDEFGMGLYDPETGEYMGCLDEDGPYIESLRFYNKLYQAGLVDPDSMTQTYTEASEKVQSGGTFFSIFNYAGYMLYNTDEHTSEGKAMKSLVPDGASPIVYGMSSLGGNRVWSIGAKTQYPEKCMEIINWLCTPEGRLTLTYGPKGVTWDYDEDGNTYFTELGEKTNVDATTSMEEAGYEGTFEDGMNRINNITWAADAPNPESNGETYNYTSWKLEQAKAQTDIDQDWSDFTGCTTINEYMLSGYYRVSPSSSYVETAMSEEMKTHFDQTKTAIVTGSWNAIYAESDEEFESIVASMIKEAKSYYYDEMDEWYTNEAKLRYAAEQEMTGGVSSSNLPE